MAANLIFVPGRTTNIENPILNRFRFVYNSKWNNRVYWRCAAYKKDCTAIYQNYSNKMNFLKAIGHLTM